MDYDVGSSKDDDEQTNDRISGDYNSDYDGSSGDDEGGYKSSDESDDSDDCTVVYSPGGKSKLYRPHVPQEFMPDKEAHFQTIDDAVIMYSLYAKKAGFVERLNTIKRFGDDTIRKRYVVCNKAGKKNASGGKRRNSNNIVNNCKEHIIFERASIETNVFTIWKFEELHNHPLLSKDERIHSKKARKLTYKDKEFIVRVSKANLGPSKAHKLRVCLEGGYDLVGPEVDDYKNFRLKMGNIIGDKDAQVVVDLMNGMKEESDNYTFEYKCVNSVLNVMFWADDTDKLYYKDIGDIISFDATFRTNKYGMIFVPFTAIDNHKRSVTVGARLLSNESIESYTWLLNSFLIAHGKQPRIVLTDQDVAIQQAVEAILPESIHRLCMWHIMKKLQANVAKDFLDNTDFRKRFNKLVWNIYLEPQEFEEQWHLLINEYNLEERKWFVDMFDKRKSWIPAYFKHVPMHGLMKTISMSESSNSFFNKYAHYGNLLIYFMMNYDMTIEKQRNKQRRRDKATMRANYKLMMPTELEKHASKVYTKTSFFEVQKDMFKGVWSYSLENVEMVDGLQVVIVSRMGKNNEVKTKCKVELNLDGMVVKCSCQLFTRMRILCRHVFVVLKNNRIEKIQDQYILRRWGRDAICSHLLLRKHDVDESNDGTDKLVLEAYNKFEYCLDDVKRDKDKLLPFVENTRSQRRKLKVGRQKNM